MKSLLLFFYVLLAFVLSAWLLQYAYFIGDDGAYYVRVAANLTAGKGITFNPGEPYLIHPPLYPLMIGLFNLLFRNLEFSAHLVSIVAFSLTLIPLFFLTQSAYSRNAAHWTCLLYITNGFILAYSNLVMADTLFILLVMIELYLVHQNIQGRDTRLRLGALIGWIGGTAYLTRPEGLVFYLAGATAILILSPKPFGFKMRFVLLSMVTFLILFLPYVHFVYQKSHKFQFSQGITEIFIKRELEISDPDPQKYFEAKKIREGLSDDKKRLKMDELVEQFQIIPYLTKDHFKLIRSVGGSLVWRFLELNRYLFGGLGFLLIGAAWVGTPWNRQRKKFEFLLFLFFSTFLLKLLGQFLPRYFLHYFPLLLMWMGNGIEVLRNWAKASFNLSQKGSLAVVFVTLLFLALPSAWYQHRVLIQYPMPFEYKEMGLWMKKNIPGIKADAIASRQPAVSFYSGARILRLPYVDRIEDLLTYMGHKQARYLVVADDLDRPFLDIYQSLLDETQSSPSGLARVHTIKGIRKLVLYRVTG